MQFTLAMLHGRVLRGRPGAAGGYGAEPGGAWSYAVRRGATFRYLADAGGAGVQGRGAAGLDALAVAVGGSWGLRRRNRPKRASGLGAAFTTPPPIPDVTQHRQPPLDPLMYPTLHRSAVIFRYVC